MRGFKVLNITHSSFNEWHVSVLGGFLRGFCCFLRYCVDYLLLLWGGYFVFIIIYLFTLNTVTEVW